MALTASHAAWSYGTELLLDTTAPRSKQPYVEHSIRRLCRPACSRDVLSFLPTSCSRSCGGRATSLTHRCADQRRRRCAVAVAVTRSTSCARYAKCGSPTRSPSSSTNSSNISVTPTMSKRRHIPSAPAACSSERGGTRGASWQVRPRAMRVPQSGAGGHTQSGDLVVTKCECHESDCSSGIRSSETRLQRQPAARSCSRMSTRSGMV
mmetsp:Transcript_4979/g.16393  ORF Transcript_4979/g.16393 Transcript_4979/m.16393 type:complete len:208 (-) Transcript_4979:272-895(-)